MKIGERGIHERLQDAQSDVRAAQRLLDAASQRLQQFENNPPPETVATRREYGNLVRERDEAAKTLDEKIEIRRWMTLEARREASE